MNPVTENQTLNSKLKKKLIILSAIWIFVFVTLYSCVIAPLFVFADNDILLMESALPIVLEWVYPIVDVISLALGYGFAAYAIYEFGFKGALPIIAVPAIGTLYKYAANLIISYVMSKESMGIDYVYSIFYAIMELIFLAVFVAIANKRISAHKEVTLIRAKGLKYLGQTDDSKPVLPFEKVISRKNPIQSSMFIISVIMAVIRVLQRIRLDIFLGLPSGAKEIFTMVIYYVSDLLVMPITYVVMMLAVNMGYGAYLKLKLKLGAN